MRLGFALLLIVITALTAASAAYAFYTGFYFLDTKEYAADANFTTQNRIGFNLDRDAIHFGKIPFGSSSQRLLEVENSYRFRVRVNVYAAGQLDGLVRVEPEEVVLEPGQIEKVSLTAFTPKQTDITSAKGKIVVEVRRKLI